MVVPGREQALCQRPVIYFQKSSVGKSEWNGKPFVKPDESSALMHGFVPFLVLRGIPLVCLAANGPWSQEYIHIS